MALQRFHLGADRSRFQHGDGGLLEGHVRAAVQVGAARADGADELLGADDPRDPPSGQAEALREAVDEEHVVLVHVFDIVRSAHRRAITIARVVVASVELVQHQRGPVPADVLNLSQLRVFDHLPGWVSRVGGQDDARTACYLSLTCSHPHLQSQRRASCSRAISSAILSAWI